MKTNVRIVVGVDGSEGGARALRWALAEAEDRGATVQAVTVWNWDGLDLPPHGDSPEDERDRVTRELARTIETTRMPTGVSLATEVVEGRPADVLTAAAGDADLLVLGSHGHSRVRHTVLGSVSEECIRKAGCPVVVIPVGHNSDLPHAEPAVVG